MSEPRIYVGTGKARVNNFGNQEIKISLSPEDIVTLNNSINSGGWINLVVAPRREVNAKGVSHSVMVDTWEPNQPQQQNQQPQGHPAQTGNAPQQQANPMPQGTPLSEPVLSDDDLDCPF